MVSKKQLEPKRGKKTGVKILAIAIIIVIALVLAITVPPLFEPKTIEIGDCTEVEYIGKFAANGKIFTTTYDDPINKTGGTPKNLFVNPNKNLAVAIGCGATYIPTYMPPDAIRALIGMSEGETKNITLSPSETYGGWDISLAEQYGGSEYPIDFVESLTYEISKTEFSSLFSGVDPVVNATFDYGALIYNTDSVLTAKIINITGENLNIKFLPVNGTSFMLPTFNWMVTFLVTNDNTFTIHSDIPLNHTFTFQDPDTEKTLYGKIINVNGTLAIIALNNNAPSIDFVGQSLVYEFKVVKITKTAN